MYCKSTGIWVAGEKLCWRLPDLTDLKAASIQTPELFLSPKREEGWTEYTLLAQGDVVEKRL